MNKLELEKRLIDNGGYWLGFKIGRENDIIVRVRRNAHKYFYLVVDEVFSENKITVRDVYSKEKGIAIRFNNESFALAPELHKQPSLFHTTIIKHRGKIILVALLILIFVLLQVNLFF